MSHLLTIIDTITHMINLCISTVFPSSCKSSIVLPLIKIPGLDPQVLKNYRPVSNLSFLSKLIEKVISSRILTHIADNDLIDKFQSVYRCGHSTETVLLRVYSDIVTMVGKGNGSYLVLLDLSAAFDTVDHDTLFVILEKYIGITGSVLQILKSHFSDRAQRIVYKIVILTFNAFINRTTPLYLCELIEQQNTTTNTRLTGNAFLLKLPPHS